MTCVTEGMKFFNAGPFQLRWGPHQKAAWLHLGNNRFFELFNTYEGLGD